MEGKIAEAVGITAACLTAVGLLYFGFVKPLLRARKIGSGSGQTAEGRQSYSMPLSSQSPLNTSHDFKAGGGFPNS